MAGTEVIHFPFLAQLASPSFFQSYSRLSRSQNPLHSRRSLAPVASGRTSDRLAIRVSERFINWRTRLPAASN